MSYTIRGETFATRRAVTAYCTAMLSHAELSRDDELFVRALLGHHPLAKDIAGTGLQRIVVGRNSFGDPCFVAERIDGTRRTFSHVTCTRQLVAGSLAA